MSPKTRQESSRVLNEEVPHVDVHPDRIHQTKKGVSERLHATMIHSYPEKNGIQMTKVIEGEIPNWALDARNTKVPPHVQEIIEQCPITIVPTGSPAGEGYTTKLKYISRRH